MQPVTIQEKDYEQFIINIHQHLGIDLSLYKEVQMKRRMSSLIQRKGFTTFQAFFDALMQQPPLKNEFLDRMTINVSEFWRNANRWHVLKNEYLPQLLRESSLLRCWSAACSSGEEPYTLAMILDRMGSLSNTSILATDLDANVLQQAKNGVYLPRSLREVPSEYVESYFTETEGAYKINPNLQRSIRFKQANLLHDPFESNLDLIICRNVMIYFTEQAKIQLYSKFSQALKPGGILFVGSTEQIFSPEKYDLVCLDSFFYMKQESS